MSRLDDHLDHILSDVVPTRGAAQDGLDPAYVEEIEARAQPPHLVRGLEQWNAGRLYEQHETLEWLWRATPDPVRDALKGIIQSGVGGYHVQNRNRRGALGKWTGAIGYLEPFDGLHPYGIDIGDLRQQVLDAREALLADETPDWEAHLARVRAMRVRAEPRVAEPRVTRLLRRLDRAWQDSPLSVEANIEGLSEAEAVWRPTEDVRTIRYLLIHIGLGKALTVDRCFGDASLELAEVPRPDSWRKLRRWLTHQHEALREPLGFLRDPDLHDERTIFGATHPIETIVQFAIEHDLYHAGEINRIRETYRATRPASG